MVHIVGIDHSYAAIAAVGHAVTHEWGRRPRECMVAWSTTASGAKSWSVSILPRSSGSEQLIHAIHAVFEAELIPLLIDVTDAILLGENVDMHDVTMVDKCKQGSPMRNTHVNNGSLKARKAYRHRLSSQSCLKYVIQIYFVKYDNFIEGIPTAIVALYLVHLSRCWLYAYNARLVIDDLRTIEHSDWRRREFHKLCTADCGRMGGKAFSFICYIHMHLHISFNVADIM